MTARRVLGRLLFGITVGAVGTISAALTYGWIAAAAWTYPARVAPAKTPADHGLEYETLQLVTEDGLTLAAWYVPSRNGAAMLMVHGISGNRADTLRFGRDLAERGYGVLWFDLRAHGESDGATTSFGVHEVHDAR